MNDKPVNQDVLETQAKQQFDKDVAEYDSKVHERIINTPVNLLVVDLFFECLISVK